MNIIMNKKNTKNPTDQEPTYRYNKVFVTEQRSPNSVGSSYIRTQKSAQYGNERNRPEQNMNIRPNVPQQENKHNDSKGSKEAIKQQIRKEEKQINTSRSRSKQKKDRLTLNLAKFARKPPEKAKSPINIREKQVESIYLQRGEKQQQGIQKQESHQSKLTIERRQQSLEQVLIADKSSIEKGDHTNRRSFFSEDFEDIISDMQQPNNNKNPIQAFLKSKAGESHKRQAPSINSDYGERRRQEYSNPVANKSEHISNSQKFLEQSSKKQSREGRNSQMMIDRPSYQLLRGQQTATIEELNQRLKIQKEESGKTIKKLQMDKRQLQQKNRTLIQSQFKIKNQFELMKVKNIQLIKEVQNLKELYHSSNEMLQGQKIKQDNLSNDLQYKYRKACRELNIKQDEASQLSLTVHYLQSRCAQLQSKIKTLQNQRRINVKQNDFKSKQGRNELQELINGYQIKIKQLQLKMSTPSVQEVRYKTMWEQMQTDLRQLRKQLNLKEIETEELVQSQKEFKFKQKERKMELDNKYREIDNLVQELNHNQEQLHKQKTMYNESVRSYETKLIKQQAQIDILQEDIRNIKATNNLQKLQSGALDSAFNLENSQVKEEYNAFVTLQRKQTEEMNDLRRQLQLKAQQIYRVELENEELKSKVRLLQQENEMGSRTLVTNLNNLKQAKDANQMVLRSEVESLKRKITSLQMRMKSKDNEITEKNRFIKQFLMGDISKRQDASSLVLRLEQALSK